MNILEMPYKQSISLVKRRWLARLACSDGERPYVVPIQYAYANERLYAFTLPGKKLDLMRKDPRVCVQIDQIKDRHSWKSVLIAASFIDLSDDESREERHQAWALLGKKVDWWEPGALKPPNSATRSTRDHVFFALEVVDISGRATES